MLLFSIVLVVAPAVAIGLFARGLGCEDEDQDEPDWRGAL
jgi:hypothetical protein